MQLVTTVVGSDQNCNMCQFVECVHIRRCIASAVLQVQYACRSHARASVPNCCTLDSCASTYQCATRSLVRALCYRVLSHRSCRRLRTLPVAAAVRGARTTVLALQCCRLAVMDAHSAAADAPTAVNKRTEKKEKKEKKEGEKKDKKEKKDKRESAPSTGEVAATSDAAAAAPAPVATVAPEGAAPAAPEGSAPEAAAPSTAAAAEAAAAAPTDAAAPGAAGAAQPQASAPRRLKAHEMPDFVLAKKDAAVKAAAELETRKNSREWCQVGRSNICKKSKEAPICYHCWPLCSDERREIIKAAYNDRSDGVSGHEQQWFCATPGCWGVVPVHAAKQRPPGRYCKDGFRDNGQSCRLHVKSPVPTTPPPPLAEGCIAVADDGKAAPSAASSADSEAALCPTQPKIPPPQRMLLIARPGQSAPGAAVVASHELSSPPPPARRSDARVPTSPPLSPAQAATSKGTSHPMTSGRATAVKSVAVPKQAVASGFAIAPPAREASGDSDSSSCSRNRSSSRSRTHSHCTRHSRARSQSRRSPESRKRARSVSAASLPSRSVGRPRSVGGTPRGPPKMTHSVALAAAATLVGQNTQAPSIGLPGPEQLTNPTSGDILAFLQGPLNICHEAAVAAREAMNKANEAVVVMQTYVDYVRTHAPRTRVTAPP